MAMGRKKDKWVGRWEKTEEEEEQYRVGNEKKLVEDWRSDNKRNDEDGVERQREQWKEVRKKRRHFLLDLGNISDVTALGNQLHSNVNFPQCSISFLLICVAPKETFSFHVCCFSKVVSVF